MLLLCLLLTVSGVGGVAFDEMKAIKLYMATLASYCGQEVVLAWSCGPCDKAYHMTNVQWLNSRDPSRASGYVGTVNELGAIGTHCSDVVVVMRGNPALQLTKNTSLFTSERAPFAACNGSTSLPYIACTVSQYFRDGYLMMRDSLFQAVSNYTQTYRDTYPNVMYGCIICRVTGFSLGGALASLAATDLKAVGNYNVVGVYTYGEPRVGDSTFAYWYNGLGFEETFRVVNNKDKVPFLLTTGYHHHWREVFYYKDLFGGLMHWKECAEAEQEDPTCSYKFYAFQRGLDDHFTYFKLNFGEAIAMCSPNHDKSLMKKGNLQK